MEDHIPVEKKVSDMKSPSSNSNISSLFPNKALTLSTIIDVLMPGLIKNSAFKLFYRPTDTKPLTSDYQKILKDPIDMRTIRKKLENNCYWSSEECKLDFTQMFVNFYLCQKSGDVVKRAHSLQRLYICKLQEMPNVEEEISCSSLNESSMHQFASDTGKKHSLDKVSTNTRNEHSPDKCADDKTSESDSIRYQQTVEEKTSEMKLPAHSEPSTVLPGRLTNKLLYLRDFLMPALLMHQFVDVFLEPFGDEQLDLLAQYHEVIKHPISLSIIADRLKNNHYQSLEQCNLDFMWMFSSFYLYQRSSDEIEQAQELHILYLHQFEFMPISMGVMTRRLPSELSETAKELCDSCEEDFCDKYSTSDQITRDLDHETRQTKTKAFILLALQQFSISDVRKILESLSAWDELCTGWLMLPKVCSDMKPNVGIASFLWMDKSGEKGFINSVAKFLLFYKLGLVPVTNIAFINYGLLLQSKNRIPFAANDPDSCEGQFKKKVSESSVYQTLVSKFQEKIIGKELISYLKYELPGNDLVCIVSRGIFGTAQRSKDGFLPESVNANQHQPAMTMLIGGFSPQVNVFLLRLDSLMKDTVASSAFHIHFNDRLHKKNAKALITIFKDSEPRKIIKEKSAIINTWIQSTEKASGIAMAGVATHAAYILKQDTEDEIDSCHTGIGIAFCGETLRAASVVIPKKMSRSKAKKTLTKILEEGIVKPGESSFAFMFSSSDLANENYELMFREFFPKTPLVGCYGNLQFGVDCYPRCEDAERKRKVEPMSETTVIVICSVPE